MVVGYFAIRQREQATSERQVATARELAAAANANVTIDAERSVLLALAAVEESRSADGSALPEAEEALHRAVTADQIELRVPGVGGALDWSPDGRLFVTEGPQSSGIVDIRDARTGASVRSFHGHDLDVTDVAFNHDGTLLATTGADGAARVWDPATGEELHSIEHPGGQRGMGTLVQPGRFLLRRRLARRSRRCRPRPRSRVRADRPRDRRRAAPHRHLVRPGCGPPRRGVGSRADRGRAGCRVRATSCSRPPDTSRRCVTSPGVPTARRSRRRPTTAAPACSTPPPGNSGPLSSVTSRRRHQSNGAPSPPDSSRPVPTARPRCGP